MQAGRVRVPRNTIRRPSEPSATQAVVLNGVPLLLLAAAYAAVTGAVLPALWRDRGGAHPLDWAVVLVFPAIAFAAGVFGVLVVDERRPLGGHIWFSLAATLAAFLPVLPILLRWRERAFLARGVSRSLVAEERASSRDRELAAVSEISVALARARLPARRRAAARAPRRAAPSASASWGSSLVDEDEPSGARRVRGDGGQAGGVVGGDDASTCAASRPGSRARTSTRRRSRSTTSRRRRS